MIGSMLEQDRAHWYRIIVHTTPTSTGGKVEDLSQGLWVYAFTDAKRHGFSDRGHLNAAGQVVSYLNTASKQ